MGPRLHHSYNFTRVSSKRSFTFKLLALVWFGFYKLLNLSVPLFRVLNVGTWEQEQYSQPSVHRFSIPKFIQL